MSITRFFSTPFSSTTLNGENCLSCGTTLHRKLDVYDPRSRRAIFAWLVPVKRSGTTFAISAAISIATTTASGVSRFDNFPFTYLIANLVYLRSNVTDGLTMGHFCCTVHNCQNRLHSVKDSFCPEHQPLKKQCCVTACTATAEVGFRTCSITEHRDAELYHYQRGKAMFQLKDRLQRAKGSTPADSFPPPRDDSSPTSSRLSGSQFETTALGTDLLPVAFDIESPWETTMSRPNGSYTAAVDSDDDGETEYVCEGKSPNGNKVIKAFFGRKSTHNEQLSIYSCGVGAGRASFFGSEARFG